MRPSIYRSNKLEVIDDIYGEPYHIMEIKAAPKHGIDVCYGRPVRNTALRRSIILTPELVQFVKHTLKQPRAYFELPFSKSSLTKLRKKAQTNPYKTYQKWLDSPSRPSYVAFADNRTDPEYIYDYSDRRFILYSAYMSDFGIPLLRGIEEHAFMRSDRTTEYILTEELAGLLFGYRNKIKVLVDKLPLEAPTIRRLRHELRLYFHADRNAWLASRIDDLIEMAPAEFVKNNPAFLDRNNISKIRVRIKTILTMKERGSAEDVRLLALLEQDWSKANETSRKALNKHYGTDESKRIRRAYWILNRAKKI